jgi:membrane-associated phospholipid phosphatase
MGSSSALVLRFMIVLSLLQPVLDLDWRVQRAVQSMTPSALDRPMQIATEIGRPQLVLGVLLAIAAFGGPAGAETARYAILVMIPTNLIVEGAKRATHRTRPDGESRPSNASFPSSHAANAFAIAWVLSWRWRRFAPYFFVFAAVVGFSRIYLNRHFLSDVLCGAIVGVTCAWLVGRAFQKRETHPEPGRETRSG